MWAFYFGWYQGAVYSNLLASALCAGLVWWRARVHLRRQGQRHTAELAEHRADVAKQLADHHAEVMKAIGAATERR